ncbi:MAG: DUF4914 family protein [Candidatus Omnitrophica bacterium]|nr:DUF4914 family protein [Candidatus Omnitrophota bacterium]
MNLSNELNALLNNAPSVIIPENKAELIDLSLGGEKSDIFEVKYAVSDDESIVEATVVRCKNGVAVNYPDPYMRRRDPECMLIADDEPTDKARLSERLKQDSDSLRESIFTWLREQKLVLMPFYAGSHDLGYDALLVAPANASFFAAALANLQGMIPANEIPEEFSPRAIIYLAPPFRHTHCEGKQVVIHNRGRECHEIFPLNLYLGPSAKKAIYGVLLSIGEKEGWVTVHGSTVQVITPYDNELTILHEGASGGGKSEMLEYPHRETDGRLLLGHNIVTDERRYVPLVQGCTLKPVTDDMALCHPSFQNDSKKLVVSDAEEGWFVRINHINQYGVDSNLESLSVNPQEPLIFLNLYAVPKATCLIWEHIEDEPGVLCPNPRVVLPRHIVPNTVNAPVEVDVRSFGVRTPPCSKENPSYGIMGLLHMLPSSLAWLWRLVAPRGYANPSITDAVGMTSEGVGSYWPFATGKRVDQANLLLRQIVNTPKTRYSLSPNQYVGAWQVGFIPQWLSREYLARRGSAKFKPEQLRPARCPLLGNALYSMHIEGVAIPRWFLQVETQPEVGEEAYDKGAAILREFFYKELKSYLKETSLDSLGRKIIECCFDDGTLDDYEKFIT